MTVPNHKLVPDVRYLLDASESEVLPRTRAARGGPRGPGRGALRRRRRRLLKHPAYGPFDQLDDYPLIQVPGERFRLVAAGPIWRRT